MSAWDDRRKGNGYLTVWLALCLALVLSLFLVLVDGARRGAVRLEAECVTDISMQSILAEYHRELVKQYNIFAIDSSYGTVVCGKANTEEHLKDYLDKNLSTGDVFLSGVLYRDFLGMKLTDAKLTKVSIMTDEKGEVFRRKAVEAIADDVGLGLLKDVQEWMQIIEVNGLNSSDTESTKHSLDEELASYDGRLIEEKKNVWIPFDVDNPTAMLEEKRSMGILKLVFGDEAQLSQRVLPLDGLIMSRMEKGDVNRGNIPPVRQSVLEETTEQFLFREYLLKYMGYYGKTQEEDVLKYQVEYLVTGRESDVENLRSVAGWLCALREAANALYLLADTEKREIAGMVAEVACTLLLVPEIAPVLEAVILLGWAFAESVYDVKSLLCGGRIPLIKDDESWHYDIWSALSGSLEEENDGGSGLSYADYLRIFMMLTDTDTLTGRAMNMVEADIRNTPGNGAFRLDGCYVQVEADIRIESSFGSQVQLVRQRSYD